MAGAVSFLHHKEFWYLSAFANGGQVSFAEKQREVEAVARQACQNVTAEALAKIKWNPKLVSLVIEMGQSVSISCTWHTFLEGFPYREENTNYFYNRLGYFEFEVEYFAATPARKQEITPIAVQQLPVLVLDAIRAHFALKKNKIFYVDTESPIFTFVVSNQTTPGPLSWTKDAIQQHKKDIGAWTEIYSGSWDDYSEQLFEKRVENNLSNRLSEMHFIKRNSGFIYMHEDNYQKFFDSYMRKFVLAPTAQIRSMLFSLISINESLDILFIRQGNDDFIDISVVEEKMRNLKQLRGALQLKMSEIYSELDYNKRQHYSSVLLHLLQEFNMGRTGIFARVHEKFDVIYDSMQRLYQKHEAENQEKAERGLALLNVLFSLGILADFTGLLLGAVDAFQDGDLFSALVNGGFAFFIISICFAIIYLRVRSRLERKKTANFLAVDAVIFDAERRVVVQTRLLPPFRGQFSFPGALVSPGARLEDALRSLLRESCGVEVIVERKLGVYDSADRDPRGRVVSHAFLCRLPAGAVLRQDAQLCLLPAASLAGVDLAFDHEDMLSDALTLLSAPG